MNRKKRLKKIDDAKREIESSMLTLKEHFKITWTENGFQSLYYLVRLAKKAP